MRRTCSRATFPVLLLVAMAALLGRSAVPPPEDHMSQAVPTPPSELSRALWAVGEDLLHPSPEATARPARSSRLEDLLESNPDITWLDRLHRPGPRWFLPGEREAWGLDSPDRVRGFVSLALRSLDERRPSERQFSAAFLHEMAVAHDVPVQGQVWQQVLDAARLAPVARRARLLGLLVHPCPAKSYRRTLCLDAPDASISEARSLGAVEESESLRREAGHGEAPDLPSGASPSEALAWYRRLPEPVRERALNQDGRDVRLPLDPAFRALLGAVARDPSDRLRAVAACNLDRHGIATGAKMLREVAEGDLAPLCVQTLLPYQHLASIAPDSRFARGCREYGEIRGRDYFSSPNRADPWPEDPAERIRAVRRAAPLLEGRWRRWLSRYPDHPGADDAQYWLIRSQEWQGKRFEALLEAANGLAWPAGDGDMRWRIGQRFMDAVDTHAPIADLEEFLGEYPDHLCAPLVRYSLAVRRARAHRYREALHLTAGLDLGRAVSSLPLRRGLGWYGQDYDAEGVGAYLDRGLTDQRRRWEALLPDSEDPSPEAAWRLAWAWSRSGGFRAGYLLLHLDRRYWHFYSMRRSDDPGRTPGLCTDSDSVAAGFRAACANAVALDLLARLEYRPDLPDAVVERILYLQVELLRAQAVDSLEIETREMGRLPCLPEVGPTAGLGQWYRLQAERSIRELRRRVPDSRYEDDVLLILFDLTRDPAVLEDLRARYAGPGTRETSLFLPDSTRVRRDSDCPWDRLMRLVWGIPST